MSYRNHGIPVSFELDKTTVAEKKIGQLVTLNSDGKAITTVSQASAIAFPLIEEIDEEFSNTADVTVGGIAKVYVEDASGIVPGLSVGIGATGLGVELFSSGFKLGIALEAPKGNGDTIPVLLTPVSSEAVY